MKKTTKLRRVVKGLLLDNDEVLILKRTPNDIDKEGLWDLPGGGVEDEEHPINALIREAMEEIGIEVAVERHLCRSEFDHYHKPQTILCEHYAIRAIYPDRQIRLSEEHVDYRWVLLEDLKDYNLLHGLKKSLDLILESINA